jgi:PAS domain S-box-containing protein
MTAVISVLAVGAGCYDAAPLAPATRIRHARDDARPGHGWLRYAAAVGLVAAAVTLRGWLLGNVLGAQVPFLPFVLPVALAAWLGGLGPGLLATVLGALTATYLFVEPVYSLRITGAPDAVRLGLFLVSGGVISVVCEQLRRAQARAESATADARRHESAGRLAADRFRLLADNVADYAIILSDPDGVVTDWTRGAENVLGWARDEMVGRSGEQIFTPEDRAAGIVELERANAARDGRATDERWHVRKDGTRFWASGVHTALRDGGRLVGFCKILRDLTDRRDAEEAMKAARHEAEAGSAAKDQFLAALSHELRTPLTPVYTIVQMLEADPSLPPDARVALATVRRNVELETRLIDDLLDVTRITRGKLPMDLRPTDLHEQVRHVLNIVDADARGKGVELTTALAAQRHRVNADAARLQQVFWNLLKNAIKFTPAGGRVTLSTRDAAADGTVEVTVTDTGVGIDPALLARVFEPFEQGGANVTRLFGGLGLGLAISRAIVDRHGGHLAAHSRGVGRGATFTVSLPCCASGEPEAAAAPEPPAAAPAASRLLLVEDHPDTAAVMARLLTTRGYSVRAVGTVAAALLATDAEPFDLVVSDIGLPDGSGLDLMSQLKAKYPRLAGVALSGYGMEDDVRRSRDAGFDAHLIKPVAVAHLESTLRQIGPGSKGEGAERGT